MTSTFLKRYYFDDRKLLQRTFLELVRALDSDRMVAVTGSMATESQGHPAWKDFRSEYLRNARRLLRGRTEEELGVQRGLLRRTDGIIGGLASAYTTGDGTLDTRVALGAAKETLRVIDEQRRPPPDWRLDDRWDPRSGADRPPHEMGLSSALDALAAEGFRRPRSTVVTSSNVALRLLRDLGVSRFVTLNYDFELERATMASDEADRADEPSAAAGSGALPSGYATIMSMIQDGRIRRDDRVRHRLSCTLPDGTSVDSDVFDRDRPDTLLEFAIGSAQVDQHVFHLHGRACTPSTMIIGTRDYDRLYRQTHPSRLPFREGLRVLFAGNPILFVGLGMSEAEVNETLQTFVSDNPYRYQAPIFLLWNTWANGRNDEEHRRKKRVARLDWLMRLGVFVIFDDELEELGERPRQLRRRAASEADPRALRDPKLVLLADTIEALAKEALAIRARTRKVGQRFRDTRTRIEDGEHGAETGGGSDGRRGRSSIRLWAPMGPPSGEEPPALPDGLPDREAELECRPLVLVGQAGVGKGALARRLLKGGFADQIRHRMLVNASFCYDTDSLADALVRFLGRLHRISGGRLGARGPRLSRERLLEQEDVFNCEKGLVVINGIDRFFTAEGVPLSVEFDQLLRKLAQSPGGSGELRFVLLGTERVRRYFGVIGGCDVRDVRPAVEVGVDGGVREVRNRYLEGLIEGLPLPRPAALARMEAARRSGTSSQTYRQALVATVLDHTSLEAIGVDPDLSLALLRTLAFIGMPIEAVVLLHSPAVRSLLLRSQNATGADPSGAGPEDVAAERLCVAMEKLVAARVVVEFVAFQDYPGSSGSGAGALWRRFGLHRTIVGELRERHGIPLSRSKRATAFNMSLYTAQPVDSDTPEPETHDELALLIDRLIGSYKDAHAAGEWLQPLGSSSAELLREQARACRPPLPEDDALERLLSPASVACLRAALAVLRGYYSTTTLLSIDRGQRLVGADRDGALMEHAERLERLLRAYRRLTRFRDAWVIESLQDRPALDPDDPGEWSRREARLASIGPEPFYPDEIVWVFNELGTVRLAQGDLYLARSAFDRALEVNGSVVEFSDQSHNWRRIMLNSVMVEIERGRLPEAEAHLREIEATVDERIAPGHPVASERRSVRIVHLFARPGEHAEEESVIHPEFLHEEILTVALVRCVRGLAQHLRGHLRTAKINYLDGIRILRRLGEHRAYALFQRYYAQLLRSLGDAEGHKVEIGLAVAAAESVRQMDFAYPARMIQAEPVAGERPGGDYLRQALAAQEYAMLTDNHRVRVDAATRLARAKLASGDYEMALDHATDALTTATRFGMSLRKVALRILIGQILIRRGDRRSGTAMIDAAIVQADRMDYQRAVALAQGVRATESVSF